LVYDSYSAPTYIVLSALTLYLSVSDSKTLTYWELELPTNPSGVACVSLKEASDQS